ncbi:unnamed protein product [Gordionus sp. m RMFG-2023]|uniref:melanotransferrin-like n=1 Tax=Gordionus sp. m RMFG-2023 TaxID=3053472 RepID=UPI0030E43EC1
MVFCRLILLILTLISVKCQDGLTARWCVINVEENNKCLAMSRAFGDLGLTPRLECLVGKDVFDCMTKIKNFEADLVSLDPGYIYKAGQEFSLSPILAEVYGTDKGVKKPKYNGVAVIKASDNSINSLNDLKNKKSCHTAVGRSSGWIIPIGTLLRSGVMEVVDCNNPVLSASKFFKASCAPGANNETYKIGGNNVDNMCELCAGTGEKHCSTSDDEYAGYDGAFKCLRDGQGDIAFVKDATPLEMTKGQLRDGFKDTDFKLLCPDGRKASIFDSQDCFWGSSPAHAVMTLSGQSDKSKQAFKNLLLEGQKVFGVNGSQTDKFRMFGQSNKIYGHKDLLFKDSTVELIDVGSRNTSKSYLGSYAGVVEGNNKCNTEMAIFCVTSKNELNKVVQMSREFSIKNWFPKIIPLKAETHEECMKKISSGDADIAILDGGDAYLAGSKYGLVPILHENYGANDASYYAVAVVKKSDSKIDLKNLKGLKSCHTGIDKTAGWNVPVSFLIDSKQISSKALKDSGCNIPEVVSQFFKQSCAPGANDPRFFRNPKKPNPVNLCALCKGKGKDFCARNSAEPFYDYSGSFRCLVESGPGTVAFMKHTTVQDNTDGNNQQPWARGLQSHDYELLCRDGTRKGVSQWKSCFITKVPAEVMVASPKNWTKQRDIINLFLRAQESFGEITKSDPNTFSLFRSSPNEKDTLFKDDTTKLERVPPNMQNFREYLGTDYINMLKNINCGEIRPKKQRA